MEDLYNDDINRETIITSLSRITNQIFKLLPTYEEGEDWEKPLQTLVIEISGLASLFPKEEKIFSLLCKTQGLLNNQDIDFMLFRRTVFECCSLASKIKEQI